MSDKQHLPYAKSEVEGLEESSSSLVEGIRNQLDRSCDSLDGHTLSRLNAIRHQALEHKLGRQHRRPLFLPLGGLVTACVLVIAVSLSGKQPLVPGEFPVVPVLEDLELLVANEGFEFYEDYEFYQWLAAGE